MEITLWRSTPPSALHSAAQHGRADPKTVRRYVAARDAGRPVTGPGRRPRITDEHLPKIEEWVDRSEGKARADVIHARLVGWGSPGPSDHAPRGRRPWGPRGGVGNARTGRLDHRSPGCGCSSTGREAAAGRSARWAGLGTLLFCAWLAWSRYRVVIPTWDQSLPTLVACLTPPSAHLGGVRPTC